jgi:hypothetical protein
MLDQKPGCEIDIAHCNDSYALGWTKENNEEDSHPRNAHSHFDHNLNIFINGGHQNCCKTC